MNVWDVLVRAIGREDLVGDERYRTGAQREERRAEIDELFTAWTLTHHKREVMETLGAAGIICSAVLDVADHLQDPHLVARDAIVEYEHPTRGTVRMPGSPVRFSEAATPTRRPPLLGEHTEEGLQELLGYDGAGVARLRAEGVL